MSKIFTPALFKKDKAFTLVELMIVSSIILLLTAVVLINYRAGNQQLALDRSAHKLAQDIRIAQEMAMSPREECGATGVFRGSYGIYLHRVQYPNSYLLFADCNDDKAYSYVWCCL